MSFGLLNPADYLNDGEVVNIFSRVAGQDLSQWFKVQLQVVNLK
jgi:hypothetical protein